MPERDPPALPDTSTWQPRVAPNSLSAAFMKRCRAIEERIVLRSRHERELNIDNFDSGPGVEDVVREELSRLLPTRYTTKAGVLNDSRGHTGGDYDVVIFNADWVPEIKAGATPTSRRVHLPIEGVYAVGEVKQTLGYASLDEALEKLVVAHRLHRPPTSRTRIIENRELDSCRHGLTNPLYTFIIATRLEEGVSFDALVRRFAEINQGLRRLEVVRALCVLGVGTVSWVFRDDEGKIQPTLLMGEDLQKVLQIGFEPGSDESCAFYSLTRVLMLHLYHSVLAPEDVAAKYGPSRNDIKVAQDEESLTHNSFARPVRSAASPWDYEWNPFHTGKVDRELGAQVVLEGQGDDDDGEQPA